MFLFLVLKMFFFIVFFNIVLTWKIMRVSKTSNIYIYIYIDNYMEMLGMMLSSFGLNGSLLYFILFGTTLHVLNVPPTLVYALVYFVWLYLAFNKRFLSFWAQKKFYKNFFFVNLNFRIYVAACGLKFIRFKV